MREVMSIKILFRIARTEPISTSLWTETQTLQIQIFGDLDDSPSNPAVTYLSPDTSFYVNVNNLYNDIGSNARFDEILKPCDKGWRLYDQQCWWFDHNPKTWSDALNTCIGLGGILPTILNNKTEYDYYFNINQFTAWIGLNDIASLGNWVWAQPNGNSLSLSGFTNWGTGMPVNDSNRQCVTDSQVDKWQAQNCSSLQFYGCVKNVYDYTSVFQGENANFLPSGMWTISVKTYTDPGGPAAPCEVKVFSQSGIRAFLGFSFNMHNDLESPEPAQDSAGNYFVSHVASLSNTNPGRLQYAHFYVTDNMQMTGVQQFKKRDTGSCSWEYVSTAFQCPTQNTSSTAFHPFLNANQSGFQTALTGIDFNGYLFQRIRPTVCYIRNPLRNCDNGGVYSTGRQRCVCPPDWFGDRCEFPICYNNGKMSDTFFECTCPAIINPPAPNKPLYVGEHCEYPVCTRGSNNGLPLPIANNKTFILVLDGSPVGLMGDVIANLPQILNNVTNIYAGVYTSYIGVVVRDQSYHGNDPPVSNPIVDTNFTNWLNKLMTNVNSNLYNSTTNARPLFAGIYRLFLDTASKQVLQPQSHVFVLTGAIAMDANNARAVQDSIAPYQLQVNFIYLGDTTNPGGPTVDPFTDPNLRAMYDLQYITNGGFYQVHDWTNAEIFWYTAMAHRLNSYFIQNSVNFNCTNHEEYFQIGSSSTKLLIDVYVQNSPRIDLIDNNGTSVNAQSFTRSNTNYLFSVDITQVGVWQLSVNKNVTNAGFCAIKIKGIDMTNTVSWAFTQDTADNGAHTNDAVLYPDGRSTSRNSIIANVPQGYPAFAQIYDVTEKTLLWSSPLVPRQQCTYNTVTRDSFRGCPAEQFMLVIEAYDTALTPYRRVGMVHCINYGG
uniref:C-type lectin domain-containing protein n=1 Tax=Acrobeloides nanus TaxID=290746 RepID=A0A914CGA8_9BILA